MPIWLRFTIYSHVYGLTYGGSNFHDRQNWYSFAVRVVHPLDFVINFACSNSATCLFRDRGDMPYFLAAARGKTNSRFPPHSSIMQRYRYLAPTLSSWNDAVKNKLTPTWTNRFSLLSGLAEAHAGIAQFAALLCLATLFAASNQNLPVDYNQRLTRRLCGVFCSPSAVIKLANERHKLPTRLCGVKAWKIVTTSPM